MSVQRIFYFFLCLIFVLDLVAASRFESTNERMREMAGPEIFFGEEILLKARGLEPGEKFTIDQDDDGDPDITIFNDDSPKHTIRPIFVKVIDDDDDQGETGYGDTDSDCWIADWYGDGIIDCIVDYEDDDADGDMDRMVLYDKDFYGRTAAIVCEDIGDDNRLWYTRNYTYDQPGCQWLSDFNGDELFCMFDFDVSTGELFPKFENPFVFYDEDDDDLSEIVIRFSGRDLAIERLRYSFDVDNDTTGSNRHDYDFSFNCEGEAHIPAKSVFIPTFRHGRARNGYVRWEDAQSVAQDMEWGRNTFIWDEADNTANPANEVEKYHERWEGVGGYRLPKCNFRREYDTDFSGRFCVYFSQVDQRIHLFGAESGELFVDYDYDGEQDMIFLCKDSDRDGFFDLWQVDTDADGSIDREFHGGNEKVITLTLEYAPLHSFFVAKLDEAISVNERVIRAMKAVLGDGIFAPSEKWFNETIRGTYYAAQKLSSSKEARRYYQDITREYLFQQVDKFLAARGNPLSEEEIESYAKGDYITFADKLEQRMKRSQ